ncbi:response regulator transcription factor [Kibdelosporangium phytohabitans]|uniref:response regulator n=1 Tax=Kibdelosporangium phytohabitans TaxID=860235 RepID=UPI0009FA2434|nr:response regulator transcription factor [Kibdelosporangium phytohabitans]MBE1470218.1 DNA-binding NarL/FixJ family response regulator [Kibdelosporangium phytohabitans]
MGNTETDQIKLLIADDHPVYRYGLRNLLEDFDGFTVVGEARSGDEALALTHRLRPRMVLMDVNLPGMSGIDVTRNIVARMPETSVVMVTMLEDRDTFFAAIRAGARGYLMKGSGSEDVRQAINTIVAGGLFFDTEVAKWVVEYLVKPPATRTPFPELTDRERAVLELVADGQGNVAIARALGLSIKTVRNYHSRIFAKLQVVDRTEAAVLARRAGLGH